MPTNPSSVALGPESYAVLLGNGTRTISCYRVQSVAPSFTINTEVDRELGNVDPVGSSQDPIEPTVNIDQNNVGVAVELLIGGKAVNGTVVTLAELMSTNNVTMYEPFKNSAGTIQGERQMANCALQEVTYNFTAQGVLRQTFNLRGTTFKTVTSGFSTWPTADATIPGSIRGKDAVLFLGTAIPGSLVAADSIFRVQTFTVRATRPLQSVFELGNRSLTGTISPEPPTVTVDIEVLEADLNPEAILVTAHNFKDPVLLNARLALFDPADANRAVLGTVSTGALKTFAIDKVKLSAGSPGNAQVRGLGTKRFTLTCVGVNTAGNAGLTVYSGDVA